MSKILQFDNQPVMIPTKQFKTIDFRFAYSFSYQPENMFYMELLEQLLTNSSASYPEEQVFKKEATKRFIIEYSINTRRMNSTQFIQCSLTVPNPKYVKSFNLEDAFAFFVDMIYHPNVDKEAFASYPFVREKNYIKDCIQNSMKNISTKSYQSFLTYVDEVGILKDNVYHNLDKLADVTAHKLYSFWKNNIADNPPLLLVYGDIEKKEVESLFSKYLCMKPKKIEIAKNYICFLTPREETQYIEEVSAYQQSALYMGYKVEQMREEDILYLQLLDDILRCSENDLIFKALRLEHNLVYGCKTYSFSKNGLLCIEAYLDASKKEEALTAIDEVFLQLHQSLFVQACIDKVVRAIQYELLQKKDAKYAPVNDFIKKSLEIDCTLEERYTLYQAIQIEKFISFIRRIRLDTVYFLRGEGHE